MARPRKEETKEMENESVLAEPKAKELVKEKEENQKVYDKQMLSMICASILQRPAIQVRIDAFNAQNVGNGLKRAVLEPAMQICDLIEEVTE